MSEAPLSAPQAKKFLDPEALAEAVLLINGAIFFNPRSQALAEELFALCGGAMSRHVATFACDK